jgi:hypothetical protein
MQFIEPIPIREIPEHPIRERGRRFPDGKPRMGLSLDDNDVPALIRQAHRD